MSKDNVLLEIKNLSVEYPTHFGVVQAVGNVDLTVRRGEALGLVGESGCGKSTLGFALLQLLRPPGRIAGGEIWFNGENLTAKSESEMRKIRGKHIAMIFQDPMTSLDPLYSVAQQLIEAIQTHEPEVSHKQAMERIVRLFERFGIAEDRLHDYPHQLSGGMRQRVMIGLALALNADLIIADEPTTSLDVIVEAQIMGLLKELREDFNLTLILITHNMGIVADLADRVAVMYAGRLVEVAPVLELYEEAKHPYTQGLLRSIPNISLAESKLEIMAGSPPDLIRPPTGCRFHPRCPFVMPVCSVEEPRMREVEPGHEVACWLYEPEGGERGGGSE